MNAPAPATCDTAQGVLFSALRKTKLIPEAAAKPISELAYSRCGRTDRGVSALGQVVALQLRSCARVEEPEADVEQVGGALCGAVPVP